MARYRAFRRGLASLGVAAMLSMIACTPPGPGAIHYDTDPCDYCHMTIADPRFAAQLVTRTGKVYRFDDPTCLASFVVARRVAEADVHSIWLNDHARPESLVKASEALFVVSDHIRAPMNGGAAAFGAPGAATELQATVGGTIERWSDILKKVAS